MTPPPPGARVRAHALAPRETHTSQTPKQTLRPASQDVTKTANVERAGRFFAFLFLGMDSDASPVSGGCGGGGGGKGSDAFIGAWSCPPRARYSNPPQRLPSLPSSAPFWPARATAFSLPTPPLTPPPHSSPLALSPAPRHQQRQQQRQQRQRQYQQAGGYRFL